MVTVFFTLNSDWLLGNDFTHQRSWRIAGVHIRRSFPDEKDESLGLFYLSFEERKSSSRFLKGFRHECVRQAGKRKLSA